jgi:hypothetical protein
MCLHLQGWCVSEYVVWLYGKGDSRGQERIYSLGFGGVQKDPHLLQQADIAEV